MCGIFGGIKKVKPETLKLLGILNEDRGMHSTGMFDVDGYVKDAVKFREFILADDSDFLSNFKGYLVGHTRHETTGKISAKNAHPFEYGHIIGVHNGMIRNFDTLKKRYNIKDTDMECDSEILFYLLDKKGVEGLKEVIGYYAIVWADNRKPNKLYFLQHECSLAYSRDKKAKEYMYFATDDKDLEIALGYGKKIINAREDVLYEVDINTLGIKEEKIKDLMADYWGATSYKSKSDYSSFKDLPPMEADEEEYYKALAEEEANRDMPNFTGNRHEYTIKCPYCTEVLEIEEALKEKCPYCQSYLTGMIYKCYHCEGLSLIEQIEENEKCPHCDLHMQFEDKFLVKLY